MKGVFALTIGVIVFLAILISAFYFSADTRLQADDPCSDTNLLQRFGLSEEYEFVEKDCSVCNPFGGPSGYVQNIRGIVSNEGKTYQLSYSSSCPRHAADVYHYCVYSQHPDNFVDEVSRHICSNVDRYASNSFYECLDSQEHTDTTVVFSILGVIGGNDYPLGEVGHYPVADCSGLFDSESLARTCEDSDGGESDYSQQGIVTTSFGDVTFSHEDSCEQNEFDELVEYGCSDNRLLISRVNCPENSVCQDGACVAQNS